MKDLELRKIYQRILMGLLSIENFKQDYFKEMKEIRQISASFLKNPKFKKKNNKQALLEEVRNKDLTGISDSDFFVQVKYEHGEYIESIFLDFRSYFSNLNLTPPEKKALVAFDLLWNSNLNSIFFNNKKCNFDFDDVFTILSYAADIDEFSVNNLFNTMDEANFLQHNMNKERLELTNTFSYELAKLNSMKKWIEYEGDLTPLITEMFSPSNAMKIALLNNHFKNPEIKREFILATLYNLKDTPLQMADRIITSIYDTLKHNKDADHKKNSSSIVDEQAFIMRYGFNAEMYAEHSGNQQQILKIYNRLQEPSIYLKPNKKMVESLEMLLRTHPNIVNPNELTAYIKDAVLLCKNHILKIQKPLLFVGSPGCGKTLLCKQLREVFNQDNDIFIPMGCGSGVSGLFGSTGEYRNANHGKILGSIWLSMNNKNCLNPLIIVDEIDKSGLTSTDINQNVYASLIQLFEEENRQEFTDNFFQLPLKGFYPNFIATCNTTDTIPDPLKDRMIQVIFRDYLPEEIKNIIIPLKYQAFRKERRNNLPENLTKEEIEIIYKMCEGKPRQVPSSILKYITATLDSEGKRHSLTTADIENLINSNERADSSANQIGFCL